MTTEEFKKKYPAYKDSAEFDLCMYFHDEGYNEGYKNSVEEYRETISRYEKEIEELKGRNKELQKQFDVLDDKAERVFDKNVELNDKIIELKKENEVLKNNHMNVGEYNRMVHDIEILSAESEKKNKYIQELEEENKKLRMQLSEDVWAITKEHNDLISSPTILAANLAGLGFKGTLVREQLVCNTAVSDNAVGTYTETLKIE